MLFKNILQKGREAAGLNQTTGQVHSLVQFFLDQQRMSSSRLFFDMDFDADDRCSRIFFMTADMVEAFQRNGQFIVMDATCKTTRFAMQLVLLVGIDETMQSTLFAAGLVAQEDIDSYTWLLRSVKAVVGQFLSTCHTPCVMHTCS